MCVYRVYNHVLLYVIDDILNGKLIVKVDFIKRLSWGYESFLPGYVIFIDPDPYTVI